MYGQIPNNRLRHLFICEKTEKDKPTAPANFIALLVILPNAELSLFKFSLALFEFKIMSKNIFLPTEPPKLED